MGFESGCGIGGEKRCGGRVGEMALRCWNWEGTGRDDAGRARCHVMSLIVTVLSILYGPWGCCIGEAYSIFVT